MLVRSRLVRGTATRLASADVGPPRRKDRLFHRFDRPLDENLEHRGAPLDKRRVNKRPFSPVDTESGLFEGLAAYQLPPSPGQYQGRVKYILIPESGLPAADGHQRRPHPQRHRDPSVKLQNMLSRVEVLSTPTADTGSCLLLHFDNRRYLFGNVSEGTQRTLVQRKISARAIEEIFISGPMNWRSVGGLIGMILTIGDVAAGARAAVGEENQKRAAKGQKLRSTGFTALNIYGQKNLTHMLASTRKFVFRQGMPLKPHEILADPRAQGVASHEPDWQDENLRIWHVPVRHGVAPHRKRSHDVMSEEGGDQPARSPAADGLPDADAAAERAAQELREVTVKNMFDSSWKLDTLHEVRLRDVKMPATIFIRNSQRGIEKYEGPVPGGKDPLPDIRVLVRTPWPSANIEQLPPTRPSLDSLCYMVKNQPRRGKFKVDKARELGVKNTDFKKLTAGESAPGKDGVTVTPDMVLEPTVPGHGFVVADVPYPAYIDGFLARPEWSSEDMMRDIEAMYWLTRSGEVLEDPRIVSFMRERPHVRHIALSEATSTNHLNFTNPASEAIKLNSIDSERFSVPTFSNQPARLAAFRDTEPPFVAAQVGASLKLSPLVAFEDDKAVRYLDTANVLKEIRGQKEVLALADAAKAKIGEAAFLAAVAESDRDIPNLDTEIVALGTGSALPSKNRNVSATLIRVPGHGSYLLDCGENTLGQLRRVYGIEGADEVVRDLRAIYISHLHADHHLGTVSVIRRYRDLQLPDTVYGGAARRPLGIIAHRDFRSFLSEYAGVESFGGNWIEHLSLDSRHAVPGNKKLRVAEDETARRLGISRVEACFVEHSFGAMAVSLTLPSGLKIAYSGDCRPSAEFARMARGAHLLVHECTFDDELVGDALAKKHSTMSEALGVARRMRARRVLLTHFSQRYPKIPVIGPAAGADTTDGDAAEAGPPVDSSVLFAFDYMRVRLGDFKMAEAYVPALRKLYEELTEVKDE